MRRTGEILAAFEALPETDIAGLLQGRRPLILAPHPDDESLGCGGLIAAACTAGLAPFVIILTDGSGSHPGSLDWPPAKLVAHREREAARAMALLGLPPENLHFFRQRDTALPRQGAAPLALAAQAAAIGRAGGCRLIVGPWSGDPHCDHEAAAVIAAELAASTGWALCSYPVWGWLRDPDTQVDEPRRGGWRLRITRQLEKKREAIAAHASQYGGLITDAPEGFQLPEALLEIFHRPYEVFIA